jgi:hypothetical protein
MANNPAAEKVRKLLEAARQSVIDAGNEVRESSPENEAKGVFVHHPSSSPFAPPPINPPLKKASYEDDAAGYSFTPDKKPSKAQGNDVANITSINNPTTQRTPQFGEITAQKTREKLLGVTQRLRNTAKGKWQVVQGGKQDASPKKSKLLTPDEIKQNKLNAAKDINERVDVDQYKRGVPLASEAEKRQARIAQGSIGTVDDYKKKHYPPSYHAQFDTEAPDQQRIRQKHANMPVEKLREQKPDLKVVPTGNHAQDQIKDEADRNTQEKANKEAHAIHVADQKKKISHLKALQGGKAKDPKSWLRIN